MVSPNPKRERTDRELLILLEQQVGRMASDMESEKKTRRDVNLILFTKIEDFRKDNDTRFRLLDKDSDERFRSLERHLWIGVGGLAVLYPLVQWLLTR